MVKKIIKYAVIFISVAVVLCFLIFAGYKIWNYFQIWQNNKKLQDFNTAVEKLLKNDTFGGKTPEETYNLFIAALKTENVDLAIKYIVLDAERQTRYWKEFSEQKQKGQLKKYAESLPEWSKWKQIKDNYNDWQDQAMIKYDQTITQPTKIYDTYLKKETTVQPGVYGRSIAFAKNVNNIWKISSF